MWCRWGVGFGSEVVWPFLSAVGSDWVAEFAQLVVFAQAVSFAQVVEFAQVVVFAQAVGSAPAAWGSEALGFVALEPEA